MKKLLNISLVLWGASFSIGALASNAEIRSLENMERERAVLVGFIMDTSLSPRQREKTISHSSRRLFNMERVVIRDDRLVKSGSPIVHKAFDHYEATFLIHASAEQNHHVIDHWLKQIGLSRETLLNSHSGKR